MRDSDKPDLRIRAYREAKGYTQEYMADMLNICQSTYANLESGKTTLSINRLIRIADILETDYTALLDYKGIADRQGSKPGSSGIAPAPVLHPDTKGLYEQLIFELRTEIDFLRSLIRPS